MKNRLHDRRGRLHRGGFRGAIGGAAPDPKDCDEATIQGKRGLQGSLNSPENPESIQGAKEWLEARMEAGKIYSPVLDQPALVSHLDLEAARRADSFDKCYREIVRLLDAIRQKQASTD